MKAFIVAAIAIVLILTAINKIVSFFRPQKVVDTKWLVWGLAISSILLIVSLVFLYLNWDKNPSATALIASLIIFLIFLDQFRIQSTIKARQKR